MLRDVLGTDAHLADERRPLGHAQGTGAQAPRDLRKAVLTAPDAKTTLSLLAEACAPRREVAA